MYGSYGSSCSIDVELSEDDAKDTASLAVKIAMVMKICDDAVKAQLARDRNARPAPPSSSSREHGSDDDLDYADPADDTQPGDRGYRERDRGRSDDGADRLRRNGDGRGDRGDGRNERGRDQDDREPHTGKHLYGWASDRDLLSWFTRFGKSKRFPFRFNDWTEKDVAEAMDDYRLNGPRSQAGNGNGRRQ